MCGSLAGTNTSAVCATSPDHADNAALSAALSSGIRPSAAGRTLACAMHPFHLVNLQAAAAGVRGPAATSGLTLADLLGIVALVIIPIGIAVLTALWARRPDPRDDGEADSGWGRGGGGRPPWPGDGPPRPSGDPVWWPEFERQFAQYVGERPRRPQSLDITPAGDP